MKRRERVQLAEDENRKKVWTSFVTKQVHFRAMVDTVFRPGRDLVLSWWVGLLLGETGYSFGDCINARGRISR